MYRYCEESSVLWWGNTSTGLTFLHDEKKIRWSRGAAHPIVCNLSTMSRKVGDPVSSDFSTPYEKFVPKTVKASQHIPTYFVVCRSFSHKCLTSELGYFCSKTAPIPRDEASVVICNSAFGSGSAKTGGFNMASLN
ncbi:hypothetical protein TNCV_1632471 [Trichonephila clavipes]|nr:hypothetical protein TNCV_1632471 [Trichonephila clavipes]